MAVNSTLPETGFVKLYQIIGQTAVTEEQAARNKEKAATLSEEARKKDHSPKLPREAIPAAIPYSKSSWWAGVRSGRFPKPIKLSPQCSVWRVEQIRELIAQLAA